MLARGGRLLLGFVQGACDGAGVCCTSGAPITRRSGVPREGDAGRHNIAALQRRGKPPLPGLTSGRRVRPI